MDEPPPYNETAEHNRRTDETKKDCQHFSICEEVGISRAQHVATLVSKLLPQLQDRAKAGLSKTVLLILPSDQEHLSRKGQLVGAFDEPLIIQLHGRFDGTEFWSQREALGLLKDQLFTSIVGDVPQPEIQQPLPVKSPEKSSRSSFFSRKTSKGPDLLPIAQPPPPPVKVDVKLYEANFRSFNDYGLYETLRGSAVKVVVEIR